MGIQRLLRHCAQGRSSVLDGHRASSRCTESLLGLVGIQGCRESCAMKCVVSLIFLLWKTVASMTLCLCTRKLFIASHWCVNLSRLLQWRKYNSGALDAIINLMSTPSEVVGDPSADAEVVKI